MTRSLRRKIEDYKNYISSLKLKSNYEEFKNFLLNQDRTFNGLAYQISILTLLSIGPSLLGFIGYDQEGLPGGIKGVVGGIAIDALMLGGAYITGVFKSRYSNLHDEA